MNDEFTVGIDEVGRGPWAGPLVAAAVCFPRAIEPGGITDSKQLSAIKRLAFMRNIQQRAVAIGIGWVSAGYIDRHGLTSSTRRAMHGAWLQLPGSCRDYPTLIDGNVAYLADDVPASRCVLKGDQSETSIAAASIIAKVLRDRFMHAHARLFPEYGFETHVGYGTRAHQEALRENGACLLHRHSFAPVSKISSN